MAGLEPTRDQILTEAGLITRNLQETLNRAQDFKFWLDQYSSAALQAAPFNLTQTEADNIKSALADADSLRAVAFGAATQGTLKDFRDFWKRINGFGYVP